MPSEAYKTYVRLLKQLEDGRKAGTLSERDEERMCARMDDIWFSLTAREVEALNKRLEKTDCDPYKDWS